MLARACCPKTDLHIADHTPVAGCTLPPLHHPAAAGWPQPVPLPGPADWSAQVGGPTGPGCGACADRAGAQVGRGEQSQWLAWAGLGTALLPWVEEAGNSKLRDHLSHAMQ